MSAPCSLSERPNPKIRPYCRCWAVFFFTSSFLLIQTGPRPEDRYLPGVPVGQAVEGEDLVHLAVAPGVPATVGVAVLRRREQGGEYLVVLQELDEVIVPDAPLIIRFDTLFALAFEEFDRLFHDRFRFFAGIIACVFSWIKQHKFTPPLSSNMLILIDYYN